MFIDTHAHLNFNAFKNDRKEVIRRCLDNNVWTINVGTKYETSKKAVELAQGYREGVFAAVGLHPVHLETGLVKIKNDKEEIEIKTKEEEFNYEKYNNLAQNQKVVAIGEIGLDYYWRPKTKKKQEIFKEKQKTALNQQLELALELNLPVILHCRMAHDDLLNELRNMVAETSFHFPPRSRAANYELKGVIHCFTGTWQQAEKFLSMGFYLGFNGIIFKKISGIDFKEVIEKTPVDRILLETDCPYLTPPQVEGRNEPLNIKYVTQKIAQIKNLSFEKISEISTQNAQKLFHLL